MAQGQFIEIVGKIAKDLAGRGLDADLARVLNGAYPATGATVAELKRLCAEGEADGWLMAREAGGIRFGRAVKPGAEAGDFSVDVVRMKDVRGPHHVHGSGEIGLVMALSGAPEFDGMPEGWYVYPPGSDHHPTVTGGDAYVLYFLPRGEIEFTGK